MLRLVSFFNLVYKLFNIAYSSFKLWFKSPPKPHRFTCVLLQSNHEGALALQAMLQNMNTIDPSYIVIVLTVLVNTIIAALSQPDTYFLNAGDIIPIVAGTLNGLISHEDIQSIIAHAFTFNQLIGELGSNNLYFAHMYYGEFFRVPGPGYELVRALNWEIDAPWLVSALERLESEEGTRLLSILRDFRRPPRPSVVSGTLPPFGNFGTFTG